MRGIAVLFMCSCSNFFEISLFSISKESNQAKPEHMNIPVNASPSIYMATL